MSNKKGKGPTLFIQQSFSRTPSDTHMQEIFISRQEPEPAQEEVNPISKETEQIVSETSSATQTDRMHPGFNRVKPFKEMTVQERLDYLINFPKVLPMVPCVFYTADEKFFGTLTGANEHQIIIQTANGLEKNIAINEIKNVIMIGIKR